MIGARLLMDCPTCGTPFARPMEGHSDYFEQVCGCDLRAHFQDLIEAEARKLPMPETYGFKPLFSGEPTLPAEWDHPWPKPDPMPEPPIGSFLAIDYEAIARKALADLVTRKIEQRLIPVMLRWNRPNPLGLVPLVTGDRLDALIECEAEATQELFNVLISRNEAIPGHERTCEYGRMDRKDIRRRIAGLRAMRAMIKVSTPRP